MGDRTGISWTDATWNPIRGCSRVSQGCVHCYAETVAARFSKPGLAYEGLTDKNGRWNGTIRVVEKHMLDPIRWRAPRKIFVNSMSDLFHENIADEVIDHVFAIMALASQHTFQVLTKRPARMLEYFRSLQAPGATQRGFNTCAWADTVTGWKRDVTLPISRIPEGLPNVWLGVSTEDQATADDRIPLLLQTPAAVRWISAEPLLGPIDLKKYVQRTPWYPIECEHGFDHCPRCDATADKALDWVVVGGESGPGHRPMDPDWAAGIALQSTRHGIPIFMKQDSGLKPGRQGRLSDPLWDLKAFPFADGGAAHA